MKVLIVDDDKLVALSLKTILEADGSVEVIGQGNSGKEAVALYDALQPDILLMDIRMEEMTGLTAAKQILAKYPAAKILFLTTFSDDEYIVKALRIGAKGYILKQNFGNIVPALIAVAGGQTVFGDEITNKLPNLMENRTPKHHFERYQMSDKEVALIELVAEGFNNKEIAEKLFLSEGTVRNYLSAILNKLNLRDRTQLAVFYYRDSVSE